MRACDFSLVGSWSERRSLWLHCRRHVIGRPPRSVRNGWRGRHPLGHQTTTSAVLQQVSVHDRQHGDGRNGEEDTSDAGHGHIDEPSDPTAARTIAAIAEWLGRG